MIVTQIRVGPMQNFSYLLMDEESKQALAVDSGWEIEPIVRAARKGGMRVSYAVATHGHFDHVQTLGKLALALGAKTVAHQKSSLAADLRVEDGDELKLGSSSAKVIHTPGHTEDSICLFDGANLLTGDTLFVGNCGRTDLPGGSTEKLFDSLHRVIMALPAETIIYPGHDYGEVPHRTLGEEERRNPTLLAKDLREFTRIE